MRFCLPAAAGLLALLAACNSQPAENTVPESVAPESVDSTTYNPEVSTDSARMGKAGGIEVGGVALTADQTIAQNLAASPSFSQLLSAAKQANLAGKLGESGPYTVFAPADAAFKNLPYGAMAGLLKPESQTNLQGLVGYHILQSRLLSLDLRDGQQLTTMEGQKITIGVQNGVVTVNGAQVTTPDVVSSNGVIHVIDKVLLPPAE